MLTCHDCDLYKSMGFYGKTRGLSDSKFSAYYVIRSTYAFRPNEMAIVNLHDELLKRLDLLTTNYLRSEPSYEPLYEVRSSNESFSQDFDVKQASKLTNSSVVNGKKLVESRNFESQFASCLFDTESVS